MPNYLSMSQVNKYLGCGEAYRQHYIEGKKSPPNVVMIKGSAFHKAAEMNNLQKIQTKTDLSVEELQDIASDDLDKRFEGPLNYKDEELSSGIDKVKGQAKDQLMTAIPIYHESSKDVMPIATEQEYNIQIPGIDKPLKAIIDCITDDGRVIDYKVTSRAKTQEMTDSDLQLSAYSLIYRATYGHFPKLQFHNFILKSTKKYGDQTEFNLVETHHDETTINPLINTLMAVEKSINQGIFLPAPAGSWQCSPNACPYYKQCKYVNGKPRFGL